MSLLFIVRYVSTWNSHFFFFFSIWERNNENVTCPSKVGNMFVIFTKVIPYKAKEQGQKAISNLLTYNLQAFFGHELHRKCKIIVIFGGGRFSHKADHAHPRPWWPLHWYWAIASCNGDRHVLCYHISSINSLLCLCLTKLLFFWTHVLFKWLVYHRKPE